MTTSKVKRRRVITDPEGNKVITKTRKTGLFGPKGASKIITKFADPKSSGARRQVETYAAPMDTEEEYQRKLQKAKLATSKKGGSVKKTMKLGGTLNTKVKALKSASTSGVKKNLNKKVVVKKRK